MKRLKHTYLVFFQPSLKDLISIIDSLTHSLTVINSPRNQSFLPLFPEIVKGFFFTDKITM
jgi:hypothetical protein